MSTTYYAGPGKVYFNSVQLHAEGEGSTLRLEVTEERAPIASSMFGHVKEQLVDQFAEVTFTPFDQWGSLGTLFGAHLGVSVGATTGALVVGTDPHTATPVPCKIWTPDGRLYHLLRAAVTRPPSLNLGVGKPLFGDCTITALGLLTVALGASGFLFDSNAITESAAADPGGVMTDDIIRGVWTGAWGTVAGFGGDGGDAMQAEDGWTIDSNVVYARHKVQGLSRKMTLQSASFMARCRPVGPTHSQILGIIGAHTLGQHLGQYDLVLTGPGSKTVTLKNCELVGAGFEFGGNPLGSGEVGFVTEMTWTGGDPDPLLIFSA